MTDNEKRNLILRYLERKPRGLYNINQFHNLLGNNPYKILSPLFEKIYVKQGEPKFKQEGQTFIEITEEGIQFIINGGYESLEIKSWKWFRENMNWIIPTLIALLVGIATIYVMIYTSNTNPK